MRRREFFAGVAASALPLAAGAQPAERVRLIGWLDRYDASAETHSVRAALLDGLAKLGWAEGRNLKIERRFGIVDPNRLQAAAVELVSLAPDVIVAGGLPPVRALRRTTHTIPIVFAGGGDVAAVGIVHNIARPEGNITGFSASEPLIAAKRLELLKEAAPHLVRIAVVFNPDTAPTAPQYIAAIETAASALSMQVVLVPFRDAIDLVRSVDAFAAEPNGGLQMLPPWLTPHRTTVIKLANLHRLPAVYPGRLTAEGGLMSYTSQDADQHRSAASYVDQLLRGAKVADLPVQFPTKYQLVINLKTARTIGLAISPALLNRADEVIE